MMNTKKPNFGITMIVVGLIIVGFSLIFYFGGTKESPALSPPEEIEPKLEIADLKLCYYIDEGYNCDENLEGAYKPGDVVYVYFMIEGIKIVDNRRRFSEDFELYGPDGKFIAEGSMKGLISRDEEVVDSIYEIRNSLPTLQTDSIGKYRIKVIINDLNSGLKISKSLEFIIR